MRSSKGTFLPVFVTSFCLILNIYLVISTPVPSSIAENSIIKCKRREFYHNETKQCYKERTKGPCNGHMVFLKLNSVFGDCDCSEDEIVPWVYHPETNDCYETYKQGYCTSPDEWLIFDNSREPICSKNQCSKVNMESDEEHPTVLLKEKCALLNKPSELCKNTEEVRIKNDDVLPECVSNILEFSVITTDQLKCRPGTRRDRNGTCRKTVTIESSTDY